MGLETNDQLKDNATISFHDTADVPDDDKFKFYLEDLITFVFPSSHQHPLAAARLFAFGLYGPLDKNLHIRTGVKGQRILAEYELEEMCMQFEKEDILHIYSQRPRDVGLLTSTEAAMIVNQADAHLKREKGKAMLPRLNKSDIIEIFSDTKRDSFGRISFHEAQDVIVEFRKDRIKRYKLVFPNLTKKKNTSSEDKLSVAEGIRNVDKSEGFSSKTALRKKKTNRMTLKGGTVSEAVAPRTMFKSKEGQTNADLIQERTQYLSKHAFKVTNIDEKQSSEIISNIRLLREAPPYCKDPYEDSKDRVSWNSTSQLTGTGLGSMVKSINSSTSYNKRKVTLY